MPRCPEPPTQVKQSCWGALWFLSLVQQSCQGILHLQLRPSSHAKMPCVVPFSGAAVMPRCPEPQLLCTSQAYMPCKLRFILRYSSHAKVTRYDTPTQMYQLCLSPLFSEVHSQVQQSYQGVLSLQLRCNSHAYLPCGLRFFLRCSIHAKLSWSSSSGITVIFTCPVDCGSFLWCSSHAKVSWASNPGVSAMPTCLVVLRFLLRCSSHAKVSWASNPGVSIMLTCLVKWGGGSFSGSAKKH